MAADIRGVLSELGIGKANIVGHDIRMLVAHAYAVTYPEDVIKLIIAEGVLIGLEPMTNGFSQFPRAWNFGFNMMPELPEKLTAGRERIFLDFFFDYISMHPEAITQAARAEYTRAYSEPGAMSAGFEWYRTFLTDMDFIIASKERKLTMPVLVSAEKKRWANSWCRCCSRSRIMYPVMFSMTAGMSFVEAKAHAPIHKSFLVLFFKKEPLALT